METYVIKPCQPYKVVSIMFFALFVCYIYLFDKIQNGKLLIILICGLTLLISKVLYDFSNITFLFNNQGITRVSKRKLFKNIPWEQVSRLYYVKGWSGPLYAIFSSSDLDKKMQKRLVYTDFLLYLYPKKNTEIFIFPVYTEKTKQDLDKIFKSFNVSNPTGDGSLSP